MILEVHDLSVTYGGVRAVRSVNLEVEEGSTVSVIGPNGAGKSSMLRALAGLTRPSGGRATFAGRNLLSVAPHKRARLGLALAPEGRMIIAPLTVEENLLMGGYGLPRGRAPKRLAEMFDLFPRLRERRHLKAGMLSGGEQQMLAIARGLMSDPKLLALDEPSMGLAPIVVEDVLVGIEAAMTSGVSILLAEQNVSLALHLASFVYVLVGGSVIGSGAPGELPADLIDQYLT